MNILDQIVARRRLTVAEAKDAKPLPSAKELKDLGRTPRPSLINALHNRASSGVIAEFKRKSPSKGVLGDDKDPVTIARQYEAFGAAGMSILTEEDYFDGNQEDLRAVAEAVELPALRKDFIVDEYQLRESFLIGASAVLLIVAILDTAELKYLHEVATDLGLEVLVEVRNRSELETALNANPRMIGVNNRDLKTFKVDIARSVDLAKKMPEDIVMVSESGISDRETISRLRDCGYNGFLIGEHFMKSDSLAAAFQELGLGGPRK